MTYVLDWNTSFFLRHRPKHVWRALKQLNDIRLSSRLCQRAACFILLSKCRPALQKAHSSSDKLSDKRAKPQTFRPYLLSFIHKLMLLRHLQKVAAGKDLDASFSYGRLRLCLIQDSPLCIMNVCLCIVYQFVPNCCLYSHLCCHESVIYRKVSWHCKTR